MATVSKMAKPSVGQAPSGSTSKMPNPNEQQANLDRLREQQRGAMLKDENFKEVVYNPNYDPNDPSKGPRFTVEEGTRQVIDKGMEEQLREQKFGSATRQIEMEQGRARGREIFENKLGRVDEPRSSAMAAILGQREQRMEEGFGADAFQAAREQRLRGLGSQEQMQQRALAAAQARGGIRGGAAQGQLAELMGQQMRGRQSAEQQLLLADAALKNNMLDKYASQLQGVEADELARQKFNIGQVGREKFGELSTGITEASLGTAERTGVRQADAAKAMQIAMANAGGSGGKK
jgi:hypothetical protein